MNHTKIVTGITILLIALLGVNKELLSWSLFSLFTDRQYSKEGIEKVENFDPDKDILYLPALDGKDIFPAVRDLSICRKKSIRKYIYYYLTNGREYVIRSIERSYLYEDTIKEIFKKNADLPPELAMLPLLESCFDPHAVSTSRAVGLWQFVDNTARPLGLQSNRWLDERRNVEKSTEAALRHLRALRQSFPTWELALAAYNGGAGYVRRTMDKTGARDFWALAENGHLREETGEYVPRFAALLLIYKNQRMFGIRDEIRVPERKKTEHFALERTVDLRDVSKASGVPLQTIKELNPELNYTLTPPFRKTYLLKIPAGTKKKLRENSKTLYKNKIAGIREHRVRRGETITKISLAYKKKIDLIIRLNRIKNPETLQPGQIIYVPM